MPYRPIGAGDGYGKGGELAGRLTKEVGDPHPFERVRGEKKTEVRTTPKTLLAADRQDATKKRGLYELGKGRGDSATIKCPGGEEKHKKRRKRK